MTKLDGFFFFFFGARIDNRPIGWLQSPQTDGTVNCMVTFGNSLASSATIEDKYIIVVFICISLLISDVEHLFICLLAHLYIFFEKCLFESFAHFKIRLCGFVVVEISLIRYMVFKYFFPFCRSPFHCVDSFLFHAKAV